MARGERGDPGKWHIGGFSFSHRWPCGSLETSPPRTLPTPHHWVWAVPPGPATPASSQLPLDSVSPGGRSQAMVPSEEMAPATLHHPFTRTPRVLPLQMPAPCALPSGQLQPGLPRAPPGTGAFTGSLKVPLTRPGVDRRLPPSMAPSVQQLLLGSVLSPPGSWVQYEDLQETGDGPRWQPQKTSVLSPGLALLRRTCPSFLLLCLHLLVWVWVVLLLCWSGLGPENKKIGRDPWVVQRFSACLWPREQSWRPRIESHVGLPVHGACFSLCLCLCLSLSLSVSHE